MSATATGPAGWTITTKLADAQAASTVVKAGSSTTVTVAATPPEDAPAGHTDIAVTVTAGSKTVPGTLGIDITGSFKVTLSTPNQLVSAHGPAGSGTTQQIVVKNDGTAPLTNVAMSATQPTNWTITYDTSTIASIAPGDQATVTATITPSGDAVTGDYQITISAKVPGENGTDAATNDLNMTFTVETSPLWFIAGIVLVIAILAGLVLRLPDLRPAMTAPSTRAGPQAGRSQGRGTGARAGHDRAPRRARLTTSRAPRSGPAA